MLGVVLWSGAWVDGAGSHTLCGCGDPALFLWFFQWPATAVAHGHNPFFSTAMFHPQGVNLLAQTSVLGLSLPLIPVTWLFGPVAALNVASTITPALTAFIAFLVIRRWVVWTPAAWAGGLLYGFSPFVLTSLQFAHLMTAALMLLPLIFLVLDDMLIRQTYSPARGGLYLGLLLFGQFFLSSELLAVVAVLVVVCVGALVLAAHRWDPEALHRHRPHAVRSLAVGGAIGGVLLIYPVWFALAGPGHLSGSIWPHLGSLGGYTFKSFLSPDFVHGATVYSALGGYEGRQLASSAYLGWGLLAVLVIGQLVWWRDRRLLFCNFLLAVCFVCSLGEHVFLLAPAHLFAHLPVIKNVIEQRFMAVGFLAAALSLALIVTHVRRDLPGWLALVGHPARWAALVGSAAVATVALLPTALTFAPAMPFAMRPVILPRWYSTVAPTLPPDQVLLSYPAAFSGIQDSMSWQAVNAMHYSQAGGGGPQGVANRAGSARAGFTDLALLAFGFRSPVPTGTPAQLAAVRHAIAVWGVTTVVVAANPTAPPLQQGHDPVYAAAFLTAALGRLPVLESGAWVWHDVSIAHSAAYDIGNTVVTLCTAGAELPVHGHPYVQGTRVTLSAERCVARADIGTGVAPA